jgi:hypothetical protein
VDQLTVGVLAIFLIRSTIVVRQPLLSARRLTVAEWLLICLATYHCTHEIGVQDPPVCVELMNGGSNKHDIFVYPSAAPTFALKIAHVWEVDSFPKLERFDEEQIPWTACRAEVSSVQSFRSPHQLDLGRPAGLDHCSLVFYSS